jgi:DNA-binding transcriptional MocR family regulator
MSWFYRECSCGESMRLNFSYSTDKQLDEGMKRLGRVIEKNLKDKYVSKPRSI